MESKGSMNLSKTGEIKFNDIYYVPRFTMNFILDHRLIKILSFFFNNEKFLVFVGPNHVVVHGVLEPKTSMYQYIMDDPQFPICVVEFYFLANS